MAEPVLIIGNGACAGALAAALLPSGTGVIVAAQDVDPDPALRQRLGSLPRQNLEIHAGTLLSGCSGTVGKFKVRLQNHQKRTDRMVSAVIVAEENRIRPNHSLYGLIPDRSVLSLTELDQMISAGFPEKAGLDSLKSIAFLSGLALESHPLLSERILRHCLRLQIEYGIRTVVLAGNMKVARDGLEALYRQSKKAGTVHFRFTSEGPDIRQTGGRVALEFTDEISGYHCRLLPDVTVVDETILPSARLAHLAEVLKIDRGPEGFLQTGNVRRVPIWTNRSGILAVGPARGICSENEARADAAVAALALRQLQVAAVSEPAAHARIDPDKCIRCLTCFRICPHGAVTMDVRPAVAPESCENCGLCVSACPRCAIAAAGSAVLNPVEPPPPDGGDDIFQPHLVAFCCSRSAGPAGELSVLWGRPQPRHLSVVAVPCGAAVSKELIYRTFLQGADGVLILTCHPGNCHSEQGQGHALQEAALAGDFFHLTGFESDRLRVDTLAANMGAEFSEKVGRFADAIRKLGPSRLKK